MVAAATPASADAGADTNETDLTRSRQVKVELSKERVHATLQAGSDSIEVRRLDAGPRSVLRRGAANVYVGDDLVDDVVDVTEDGVRFATRIHSARASDTFTYEFVGVAAIEASPAGDGSALLLNEEGLVIGYVDAPWAIDARGRSVDTHYTFAGAELTQHVDHARAAHPVLADPKVHYGLLLHVVLTASEVKKIVDKYQGVYFGAKTVASALCGFLGVAVAIAACAVVIQVVANQIWNSLVTAKKKGQCVDFAFLPAANLSLVYWKRISAKDKLCK